MASFAQAIISVFFLLLSVTLIFSTPIGNTRIIGGDKAEPSQFPYLVSLRLRVTGVYNHICGGSIISDKFVLTAAQCFLNDFYLEEYGIVIGARSRIGTSDTPTHKIEHVIKHYYFGFDKYLHNDIALIELSTPIQFIAGKVQSIQLEHIYINEDEDEEAVVAGWGLTNKESDNQHIVANEDALHVANVSTISFADCKYKLDPFRSFWVQSYTICTLNRNWIGAGNGDAGSPLVRNGKLIGIASWEKYTKDRDNNDELVQGYTRISEYLEWINFCLTHPKEMKELYAILDPISLIA